MDREDGSPAVKPLVRRRGEAKTPRAKGSFWSSAPGVTTAIVGLVSAVLGLFGTIQVNQKGSSPPSPTSSQLKAAYVSRANTVCADAVAKNASIKVASSDLVGARQYLTTWREMEASLRTLPTPPGDEAEVNEIYDSYRGLINAIDRVSQEAIAGDEVRVKSDLPLLLALADHYDNVAKQYGLTSCADL
jgi:hypothetical protein